MVQNEALVSYAAPSRRAPWGRALRWSGWLAVGYAVPLLAGRAMVTYRFGGEFLSPYLGALLAGALGLALLQWPLLALLSREPRSAVLVRGVLQWAALVGLALYLLVSLGSLWGDGTVEFLAPYVAPDVVGGR